MHDPKRNGTSYESTDKSNVRSAAKNRQQLPGLRLRRLFRLWRSLLLIRRSTPPRSSTTSQLLFNVWLCDYSPLRSFPSFLNAHTLPTALLSIRLRSRDNSQLPNSVFSWDQLFPAHMAFERVWVARATLRNGLVDSAAIACNPAHSRLVHVTRSD